MIDMKKKGERVVEKETFWPEIKIDRLEKRPHSRSCMPLMISEILFFQREPIFSIKSLLFTVNNREIFTTLFLGRFPSPFLSVAFPGAMERLILEVNEQTTTVFMRLRLNRLF